MKKLFYTVIILGSLFGVSKVVVAKTNTGWPSPAPVNLTLVVNSKVAKILPAQAIDIARGSIVNPDPVSIPSLGSVKYIGQGTTYAPPGFTVHIGDPSHLSGQCIIQVALLNSRILQAGDGSDGLTCRRDTVTNTLLIAPV